MNYACEHKDRERIVAAVAQLWTLPHLQDRTMDPPLAGVMVELAMGLIHEKDKIELGRWMARRLAEELMDWIKKNWCIELENIANSHPGNDPRDIKLPWKEDLFSEPGEPFKAEENDGSGSLRG